MTHCPDSRDSELQTRLADARSSLDVRTRFSRTTVNIGVSGRARVGKSTLLQSVSGLSEEQVPTGEDVNVTAIRSRLFHASRRRAFVTFHNPTTFIDEAVRPYFAKLGISPSPASLDAFVDFDLVGLLASRKESSALGQGEEMRWKRLMEVQAAVPGIRGLLTRGETVLEDLSGLRPYVAYPTVQQLRTELEGGQAAPREYLAVRDCRAIESPFPETAVDRLGIVDLPGLGEVASGIDERIVSGLRDEVDVVLFLKRAAVGMANLDKIDMDAADLIGVAQGAIEDSRDFAWMVINASKGDSSLVEALQTQILKDMNFGQADSRYFTLVADARNAREVHERVLVPVLERLSDRLSDMDAAVLSAAVSDMQTPLLGVQAAAKALLTSVARVRTESGSPRQQLDILADEMLKDVQASL